MAKLPSFCHKQQKQKPSGLLDSLLLLLIAFPVSRSLFQFSITFLLYFRDRTVRGSYNLRPGILTIGGSYILGLSSGLTCKCSYIQGSYNQDSYIQGFLPPGVLHPGVLTFRGSYDQGSDDQGFLHSGVLTIRGSYIQGFLRSGVLMFRGSYVREFLHPGVVHLRLYKEGELYKDVFVKSRGRCYIQGYALLVIMIHS